MSVSIPENSRILLQLNNSEPSASILTKCLKKNNDLTLIDKTQTEKDLPDQDFDLIIYLEDYLSQQAGKLEYEITASSSKLTIFSSGSIQLKSFTYSVKGLLAQAIKFNDYLKIQSDNFLQSLSLSSIAGLNLFLRAIASNSSISFPPETLRKSDFSGEILSLVPTHLKLWSDEPGVLASLSQARFILIGGEPIDLITERLVKKYNLPVIYTYAATELGGTVALRKPAEDYYEALPDIKFSLNQAGNLIINNSLKTEDTARLITDQQIADICRDSDWVNSSGYKFKLTDLTDIFNKAFEFTNFHIAKQQDPKFGESLIGYYQGEIEEQQIDSWQQTNLPVYQRLKLKKLVEWPINKNSKTVIVNDKS